MFNFEIQEAKKTCAGKIYKCLINNYMDNNESYNTKVTMRPLKRLSCKGCDYCGWLPEELKEYVGEDEEPIIKNPEHDKLYKLTVVNELRDFETDIIDGWDLEFVKIDNNLANEESRI